MPSSTEDVLERKKIYDKLSLSQKATLAKWRLILGKEAEDQGIQLGGNKLSDLTKQTMKTEKSSKSVKTGKSGKTGKAGKAGKVGKTGQTGDVGESGKRSKVDKVGEIQVKRQSKGERAGSSEITKSKGDQDDLFGRGGGDEDGEIDDIELNKLDDILNFVYATTQQQRSANLGRSRLSIPKWIENVNELFPKNAKEVLEKDFVKKTDLGDLVNHPELFDKVEPSLEMVKTIISLKHMLPEKVKIAARTVVKKVVDDLKDKLQNEVKKYIIGAIKREEHTPIKVFRNIDWKQSIQRNLKHYNPELKKLIMAEPRFYSAEKRKRAWQIVILVDESGSMSDSVIYSVVMASIFASLPAVHINLIIFDTQVVDLSDKIDDPVDVLMSVQLGGGTDITQAVDYGRSLIKKPKKTIMVIISDFFEGRPYSDLTRSIKQVLEGETRILGIASLGSNAEPYYNRDYANEIRKLGIDVIACTPENLSEIIARLMK